MQTNRTSFIPSALGAGARPAEREIYVKPPAQGHHARPLAGEENEHG